MADKKETSGWEKDMRLNTIFLFLVFVLVLFVCFLLLKFNQAIVLLDLLFVDIQDKVGFLIIVSFTEPLSIVLLAPISTPSSKITFPTCGVLVFLFLLGIKPKPFTPIFDPS